MEIKNKIFFLPLRLKQFFVKYLNKIARVFLWRKSKVLVVINHYYGKGRDFSGKSGTQDALVRKEIIEKALNELCTIPNVDIRVCGMKKCSLINIDQDFSYLEDPSFLIYESIEWMSKQVDKYDYFINMEDDVLLTKETFNQILEFDRKNPINECFHPNRMEYENGEEYCVDLKAWPGWVDVSKEYCGHILKVANNPHSGVAILSKKKLKYAMRETDLGRRDKIIGHYMASAYANLHAPFLMFRNFSELSQHKVIHLDNWRSNKK